MSTQSVVVVVHMETQVLTGSVSLPSEKRLSDLLNSDLKEQSDTSSMFLELTDVMISNTNGSKERAKTIYINKNSIHMLRTLEYDSARGIGAQDGPKKHPFIDKVPVGVTIRLPGYDLNGCLHCTKIQEVAHVLAQKRAFVPCTNNKIHDINKDEWLDADFIAVNKSQITSCRQEERNAFKSHISYHHN